MEQSLEDLIKFSRRKARDEKLSRVKSRYSLPVKSSYAPNMTQRVVVQCRITVNTDNLKGYIKSYLTAEGKKELKDEKSRPELFTAEGREVNTGKIENEKRYFKFMISPENGNQMDLKEYTRKMMSEAEKLTGQNLQWMAAVHKDTGHHHTHVIVRGSDDEGREIRFDPNFIRKDFREASREEATRELGLRTRNEIQKQKESEVTADRCTTLDWQIQKIEKLSTTGNIKANTLIQFRRLNYLSDINLAKHEGNNQFRMTEGWMEGLKFISLQNDITKRYAKNMKNPRKNLYIYRTNMERMQGKIVKRDFEERRTEEMPCAVVETKEGYFYVANRELKKYREGQHVELNRGYVNPAQREQTRRNIKTSKSKIKLGGVEL